MQNKAWEKCKQFIKSLNCCVPKMEERRSSDCSDINISYASSSSSDGKTGSSRTAPNCARCRNHFLKVPLKGHKRYCKWKKCECAKCILTVQRQQIMAKQTAQKRAQIQDEERGLFQCSESIAPESHLLTPPRSSVDDSPASPPDRNREESSDVDVDTPEEHPEQFRNSLTLLMENFGTPNHILPMVYVILKDSNSDVGKAISKILEAQDQIRKHAISRANKLHYNPPSLLPSPPRFGYLPLPVHPHFFGSFSQQHLPPFGIPMSPDSPPLINIDHSDGEDKK